MSIPVYSPHVAKGKPYSKVPDEWPTNTTTVTYMHPTSKSLSLPSGLSKMLKNTVSKRYSLRTYLNSDHEYWTHSTWLSKADWTQACSITCLPPYKNPARSNKSDVKWRLLQTPERHLVHLVWCYSTFITNSNYKHSCSSLQFPLKVVQLSLHQFYIPWICQGMLGYLLCPLEVWNLGKPVAFFS